MIDSESFKKACGKWCSGVAVITCTCPLGEKFGLTMSAVTPLSLSPPLFLVCLDNGSETLRAIKLSSYFCINILAESQILTSNHFASKGQNKFESIEWVKSKNGCPLIADTVMNIECKKKSISAGGDHQIVIGEPSFFYFSESEDLGPLAYYQSAYRKLEKT